MVRYDDLRSLASGNNQPDLNAEMVANYLVPLPSLDVQRRLATEFSDRRHYAAMLRSRAADRRKVARGQTEATLLSHTAAQPERAAPGQRKN